MIKNNKIHYYKEHIIFFFKYKKKLKNFLNSIIFKSPDFSRFPIPTQNLVPIPVPDPIGHGQSRSRFFEKSRSRCNSIIYVSFEINPLEKYHSKDLVELSWMIIKLMGLDAFGQSYDPLKLVEFNSGLIFKDFHFGPESRYTNKFGNSDQWAAST
jgi:hypothetical protein